MGAWHKCWMAPIAVRALSSKKTSRGGKAQLLHSTEGLWFLSQRMVPFWGSHKGKGEERSVTHHTCSVHTHDDPFLESWDLLSPMHLWRCFATSRQGNDPSRLLLQNEEIRLAELPRYWSRKKSKGWIQTLPKYLTNQPKKNKQKFLCFVKGQNCWINLLWSFCSATAFSYSEILGEGIFFFLLSEKSYKRRTRV